MNMILHNDPTALVVQDNTLAARQGERPPQRPGWAWDYNNRHIMSTFTDLLEELRPDPWRELAQPA